VHGEAKRKKGNPSNVVGKAEEMLPEWIKVLGKGSRQKEGSSGGLCSFSLPQWRKGGKKVSGKGFFKAGNEKEGWGCLAEKEGSTMSPCLLGKNAGETWKGAKEGERRGEREGSGK